MQIFKNEVVACHILILLLPHTCISVWPEHEQIFHFDRTGELAAPAVQNWLEQAREVNLQTLDDTSFEHLTQASTGATTGDWLVML